MELIIKNMVCPRCILTVVKELNVLEISYTSVALGRVVLKREVSAAQTDLLNLKLSGLGFRLLTDPNEILVERVKNCLIGIIHNTAGINLRFNFSTIICEATGADYSTASAVFSLVEGTTIEKYTILQRIERVKELLRYDELTLGEIALHLGYSSPQHLSSQFRKITGVTASAFKKAGNISRVALDSL